MAQYRYKNFSSQQTQLEACFAPYVGDDQNKVWNSLTGQFQWKFDSWFYDKRIDDLRVEVRWTAYAGQPTGPMTGYIKLIKAGIGYIDYFNVTIGNSVTWIWTPENADPICPQNARRIASDLTIEFYFVAQNYYYRSINGTYYGLHTGRTGWNHNLASEDVGAPNPTPAEGDYITLNSTPRTDWYHNHNMLLEIEPEWSSSPTPNPFGSYWGMGHDYRCRQGFLSGYAWKCDF